MYEYEHERSRTGTNQVVEALFADLAEQMERAAVLYGNATYFDSERARQLRQGFDNHVARLEGLMRRVDDPAPSSAATPNSGNRAQRTEAEIISFIQDMGKPVTIDEVLGHLGAVSLGEPRPSLITRMSRMVTSGKLSRTGRGYYEVVE